MSEVVTQQYVETLGSPSGIARISQQYSECIGNSNGLSRITQQFVEVLGKYQTPYSSLSAPVINIQI
jgi:hypothetical protein